MLEIDSLVTFILMLLYSGNLSMGRVTKLRVGLLLVELNFSFFSYIKTHCEGFNGKDPKTNSHIVYIDGSFDLFHHVKILKYQIVRNHICTISSIAHK